MLKRITYDPKTGKITLKERTILKKIWRGVIEWQWITYPMPKYKAINWGGFEKYLA